MNNIVFGISYVSIWVIIWGTLGSIIDLPFLNSEVYIAGSLGQAITFSITGLVSSVIAVLSFKRVRQVLNKDDGNSRD